MDPVIQALCLAYLFYNIYGTYKILKVPAPSTLSDGQPTVRPMTQRKRDVNGVTTV